MGLSDQHGRYMEQSEFEKSQRSITSRVRMGISNLVRMCGWTGPSVTPLCRFYCPMDGDKASKAGWRWVIKKSVAGKVKRRK